MLIRRVIPLVPFVCVCAALHGCYPTPGPDKSVAGAVLGATWGAGAGAIIGNQVDATGAGAGIGAGFGAVSGLFSGIGMDVAEGSELQMQRELDALKVQVAANQRSLMSMQQGLDDRTRRLSSSNVHGLVYFDQDRASLRTGSVEQLQRLAQTIKHNPYVGAIEVHGHSDDTGDTEKNFRLAEARARTIVSFLGSNGISLDQIKMFSHGAQQPVATNETDIGRQLNRRAEIVLLR